MKYDTVLAYLQAPNFAASQVPGLFVADPAVVACTRINPNSGDTAYQAAAKSAFYADVADPAYRAVLNLLTPDEPIMAFAAPVAVTAAKWGSVRRAYIRCTADNAIPLVMQDQMIAEADALTPGNLFVKATLDSSHSPFLSDPSALSKLLVSFA